MAPAVDESWNTIVGWLYRHCPGALDAIRPPAAEEDLRDAERTLGTALPGDLAAWWRRADGQGDHHGRMLPPSYSPYSVREALESRKTWITAWNGVVEETDPVGFRGLYSARGQGAGGHFLHWRLVAELVADRRRRRWD